MSEFLKDMEKEVLQNTIMGALGVDDMSNIKEKVESFSKMIPDDSVICIAKINGETAIFFTNADNVDFLDQKKVKQIDVNDFF